ncbi:MAG TPA: lmo0937 family membrane protein [Patescibacteria group bacterium]|nr:lmo0937 family membrane protein [Patescibacteria group bacterium]
MLWTIAIILLVLWVLGFIGNIGWFIHILLVAAIIVILLNVIRGRKPL